MPAANSVKVDGSGTKFMVKVPNTAVVPAIVVLTIIGVTRLI